MDHSSLILFSIASFALAAVLIWGKESINPRLKRPMAIIALIMVSLSFILLVISFFVPALSNE